MATEHQAMAKIYLQPTKAEFEAREKARKYARQEEKQAFLTLWKRWEALADYMELTTEQRHHLANLVMSTYQDGMEMGRKGHNGTRSGYKLESEVK